MSNASPALRSSGSHDAIAFSFVQTLAKELSTGRVDLPSFPEVASQVQRALADEDVTPLRVVKVVGAEPVLSGRIIQCANSVVFNPGGMPVLELRTAVARVGLDFVRTLTISFAVMQLKKAEMLRPVERPLDDLWLRSVNVSSLCFSIARRLTRLNADTALLAGLLHGIGKLYILTRAARHPELFEDQTAYAQIERGWHGNIAKALLESWRISDDIIRAVFEHEDADREIRGPLTLVDVLQAAMVAAIHQENPDTLEEALNASKACVRLGFDPTAHEKILAESEAETAALRAALGR